MQTTMENLDKKYVKPKLTCGPGRTIQKPTDLTDINEIVKRANRTGQLVDPQTIGNRQAVFGDFSDGQDFEATQLRITSVRNEFAQLPADTRKAFGNDPVTLLDALTSPDPQVAEKLAVYGLESLNQKALEITPETEPEPAKAVEVPEKLA